MLSYFTASHERIGKPPLSTITRQRNMFWLAFSVVVPFCVSQIDSADHTPHPYVKGMFLTYI